MSAVNILKWYAEMGVDEAIAEVPVNYLAMPSAAQPIKQQQTKAPFRNAQPAAMQTTQRAPVPPRISAGRAEEVAAACKTIAELEQAIRDFDGCSLKFTATNTVIADGNADSRVMIVGEAPGADEDRQGIPFCGVSGQLLDRMLKSIGLERSKNCYITNMIYWRPPGNRKPSTEEITICQPFVRKHVDLFKPSVVICAGGTSASALLDTTIGITKLRGKWHNLEINGNSYPCFAIYHPAYLMRQPPLKRYAWQDLLQIKQRLKQDNIL